MSDEKLIKACLEGALSEEDRTLAEENLGQTQELAHLIHEWLAAEERE